MTGSLTGYTVGFVGLGQMGTPMAARLVDAGAAVHAYDSNRAAASAFAQAVPDAELVDSAVAAAANVHAVLLMLPNSTVVESVVASQTDGETGLADALERGTVLVDMSSSEPPRTRALAQNLAARKRILIDAPVSGGVAGARAGTLAVMAGGPTEAMDTVWPLLDTIGQPRHVGPSGAGHALKALNNLMSAAHLLASSEAILIGQRFGLDPAVMLEIVNGSSGRSGSTQNKWPNHILPETFGSGFSLELMVKDVHIALDLAESTGEPFPRHAAATAALWEEAAAALPPEADHTEIVRWLRSQR